ncbi:MAG: glycoside hydrolase family 9 protein [Bacteroidia bacterium]
MKNYILSLSCVLMAGITSAQNNIPISENDYFEVPGLNVMVFQDFYPDGHQGGVTIVQNGERVAANGDLRLEPTPGQWSPVPKKGKTDIDRENNEIRVTLWYPDSSKNRTGFNPIDYPDLNFTYHVRVKSEGESFRVSIDLDKPLPDEWYGKVGFNIELFPGFYFGKSFIMDDQLGIFPRQVNGPVSYDGDKKIHSQALASGKRLVIVPEKKSEMIVFEANGQEVQLLDGRGEFNNGWFVVRTLAQKGKLKNVLEMVITPGHEKDWKYPPVIQVSQVGYHPGQPKTAVIELDATDKGLGEISLWKVSENGGLEKVKTAQPEFWGKFLRYNYLRFDFSDVKSAGMYQVKYGETLSIPFQISPAVYDRHVWQPTLEYYLPVQMCHMRINDRYKVWHGLCHDDDALMAPVDLNHFDGYVQGKSTLTQYQPHQSVPGLNVGGWHDAGDYDLRVESQATTTRMLAYMYELFGVNYDATTIDQAGKIVEMHRPDGKPDVLQQIEHGALTVVGGYEALGRLYRGIICSDLRQYTLLGDGMVMTDNLKYDPSLKKNERTGTTSGIMDDRWVFTEENPRREIGVASSMAVAYRALKGYNDTLANDCLGIAQAIWEQYKDAQQPGMIDLAAELLLATKDKKYETFIVSRQEQIVKAIGWSGPSLARVAGVIQDKKFNMAIRAAMAEYAKTQAERVKETPFGVEYRPNIWGAGWGIQSFGVNQYFLHKGYPDLFPAEPMLNSLNFVLGVHPGNNTASFVSGVGVESIIVAYGVNRDEWSYIPGGSVSGTALIRPDLPELKIWPYFWQQTEYVMGGGATNFMFLALAARDLLQK